MNRSRPRKFEYKTTAPQRTYREQIRHVAGANIMLLTFSYDYGEAVLKEFSDAQLVQAIKGPPWIGEATRAKMVYFTLGHSQDIYVRWSSTCD